MRVGSHVENSAHWVGLGQIFCRNFLHKTRYFGPCKFITKISTLSCPKPSKKFKNWARTGLKWAQEFCPNTRYFSGRAHDGQAYFVDLHKSKMTMFFQDFDLHDLMRATRIQEVYQIIKPSRWSPNSRYMSKARLQSNNQDSK